MTKIHPFIFNCRKFQNGIFRQFKILSAPNFSYFKILEVKKNGLTAILISSSSKIKFLHILELLEF